MNQNTNQWSNIKRFPVALLLTAISVTLYSLGCKPISTQQNTSGDTLRIAIELSPTSLSTEGDSLSGFHYDIVRNIASIGNRPIKISGFTNLKSALEMLDRNELDIVVSDIPATSKMKELYILTKPLYKDQQVLVRRHNDGDTFNIFNLAADTVWVPAGSPSIYRIKNLIREINDTIYIIEDNDYGAEQLVILTALGEIKQTVVNEEVAKRVAPDYLNLEYSNSLSFNQFQSWILNHADSILCDSINAWITKFQETDTFNKIKDRYFKDSNI